MILDLVNKNAISPAMALLPMALDSLAARVLLLAIGQQESRFIYRVQQGGPARGFWQCEQGGGCKGVITNETSTALARELCIARSVEFTSAGIYAGIVNDDVLAAGVSRLILFCDPKPLPAADDPAGGWECYLRNWRPGHPRPDSWPDYHAAARRTLGIS